jgi:hypothetical protein
MLQRDNHRHPNESNHGNNGDDRRAPPNRSRDNRHLEASRNRDRRGMGISTGASPPGGHGHGGSVASGATNSGRTTMYALLSLLDLMHENPRDFLF